MAARQKGLPRSDADEPVGVALARLRRRSGITGQELGRRVGMSQAKISKIETGVVLPSRDDVRRLAHELGASAEDIDRLTSLAEQHRDSMMDWRVGRHDAATWQREIAHLEDAADEVRVFQPAVISGLLQTSEYARAVLATVQETWPGARARSTQALAEAVSARIKRQEILANPDKRFHFVVPETLLRNLLSRPEDMPGQLQRLREVSQLDNVSLRMILEDERWPYPPYHGFSLLDNRYVIIDLYNTVVVTRGQSDIRLYRHVFDALEARATPDIGPILDRYRREYLRRAAQQ